ncbi:MAG: amidohydrolase family protein [Simkaniaceae bacterium]|nr:amidohydrolase family protein [Simkaniaceae bacterium]
MTKIIDFETHFYTKSLVDFLSSESGYPHYEKIDQHNKRMVYSPTVAVTHSQKFQNTLLEAAKDRINDMDKAGVDVQILSLSEPSVEWIQDADIAKDLTTDANDVLHQMIKNNPDRFDGFAAIAPQGVKSGIKELERCMTKLGFVGWLTHSNFGAERYLDNECYWPLLEAAEALEAPIYIHPMIPAIKSFGKYGFALAGPSLGFQYETALCFMRMILGGVFDRFPKLQIIMGHLGETMPYLMERLDFTFVKAWFNANDRPELKRLPSEVLKENVYVTTSGRFYDPAIHLTIDSMGSDRILFGSDYPYESMEESVEYIKNSKLPDENKEKIFYKNASALRKSSY